MSFINIKNIKHRQSTKTSEDNSFRQTNLDETLEYLPTSIARQSTCKLEVDAWGSDIVNRQEIESGVDMNPGISAIWEEEKTRRVQAGLEGGDSQLVYPKSPKRPVLLPTSNDDYHEERLKQRLNLISQASQIGLTSNLQRNFQD